MCYKPGCNSHCDAFDDGGPNRWCKECYYPGIDEDYQSYRAYREDGYGVYQSKLMVGWADPPEGNPPGDNDD